MQKDTRKVYTRAVYTKELKKIVNHLKTYLQETREEDFWHFKEVLVNKNRTGKSRPVKADLGMHQSGAPLHQTVQGAYLEKELNALYGKIKDCKKCGLSKTRINVVFARGSPEKGIMFIGEAPGYDEDRQGLPFVGKGGQLLDEILVSVGLKREEVYITNVVKCHPLFDPRTPEKRGNDRQPNKEEVATCIPILKEQIALIKPKIICTLGAVATNALLGRIISLTKIRGKFYPFRVDFQGKLYGETRLFPTFHPAAILRNPSLKDVLVNDLKKLSTELKLRD